MCSVVWRDFEIRCRGAHELAEAWKEGHDQVRDVWAIEDLVATYLACTADFKALIEHYQKHGCFPNMTVSFSYVIDSLVRFLHGAAIVDNLAQILESKPYQVARIGELRTAIEALQAIVDEDHFATRAALGSLGDWD